MFHNRVILYGSPPYSVVVVHGGPGGAGEMAPVAKELSKTKSVLEPFQTADSIDGQVQELKTILEANASLPVTLIGFSWGAWLSFIFSAKYPEKVKKLILVSSGPFEEKYAAEIMKTRMGRLTRDERSEVELIIEKLKNKNISQEEFSRFGELIEKADAYDLIPHQNDVIGFSPEIFSKVWPEASELRKSGALLALGKKIECPVVAIHGKQDSHSYDGVKKPLSAVLKHFQFFLLDQCGHKPWIEKHAREQFFGVLRSECC